MNEETVAKYFAQALQARNVLTLTTEEKEVARLLQQDGYLRPPSRGFLGTITAKGMLRNMQPTHLGPHPVPIFTKRSGLKNQGLNLE